MMLKQRMQRWKGMQHQLQQNYLRVNWGSKETKTSSDEEYREAKLYMILIAEDNRPAALTLWPSSTILLITQTKLLWAVSEDSQEHSNVCLKRLQKTRGGKNLTHYSISHHKELGPICIHPCKQGQATKEDRKHTCTTLQGPCSGHANTHQWYSRTESNKHANMGTRNRQKGVLNIWVKFVRFFWGNKICICFSQLLLCDSLWLAVSLQAWNIGLIFCCFHVQITVKNQMWNTVCDNITLCGWTNSCSKSRKHAYKKK